MKQDFTTSQYQAVQNIYAYFNEAMFGGKLNNCLLNFSRKSKAYGFFAPERWSGSDAPAIHEISLNPEYLKREPIEVISTLVHEMVHLWQADFGKPSPGYHNKEWAAKMKEIGLYPSSTGAEGGKETGKNCSHYIIKGGLFWELWQEMPKEYLYPLVCVSESGVNKASKNKTKYTCPGCDSNIWGKDGLRVICEDCEQEFVKQ
jgi:predicted SprT family Zn-dependent metalloprotease